MFDRFVPTFLRSFLPPYSTLKMDVEGHAEILVSIKRRSRSHISCYEHIPFEPRNPERISGCYIRCPVDGGSEDHSSNTFNQIRAARRNCEAQPNIFLCSSRLTQAFKTYRPQADLSPQENTLKLSHSEETHNISSPNTRPISTVTRLRDERSEFKSLQGYEFFTFLPRTL